jgi:hypothetical protein
MSNVRENPSNVNVIGSLNQDTTFGPEFTFHHGHVEKVILQSSDLETFGYPIYGAPSDVSQLILITPTFGKPGFDLPSQYLKNMFLAQPLLRGFADSISRGDSVIYINMGSKFYYLGPINTLNNPNYSPDILYNKDLNPSRVVLDDRKDNDDGYNINFIKRAINKVTKIKNIILDRPYDTGIGEVGSDAEVESNVSDLTLEGRHGNSIQLGYRFINPYSIIKNNVGVVTSKEGEVIENNGSIIGMLSLGTIGDYVDGFKRLSSDKIVLKSLEEDQDKYKGYLIGIGNSSISEEGIPPENEFNINYGNVKSTAEQQTEFDQVVIFSDRITFDAQNNDLTMSALRNINIGAGQNISITSKKHTLIQSENIYLGKQSKEKTEPMVLGEELRKILEDIVSVINGAHALVQGVPMPLVDAGGAPLRLSSTVVGAKQSIEEILSKLEIRKQNDDGVYQDGITPFLSKHHFIEINNREQNNEG